MGKVKTALMVAITILVIWALYLPLLDNYFISDDYQCIWFAASKSVNETFFSPADYRALSGSNFTPMLGISFEIDWLLSELNPRGYFIHGLVSLLLAGLAFFLFLRLFTSDHLAFAGAILFLLNPILLSVYGWNSTRHYIEGLFFALLSLFFFIRAERKGKVSIASSVFYLLSALSKEVYVLLPAAAFILSSGSLTQRIKKTLPLWAFFIFYLIWRFWMLEGMGGYPLGNPLDIKTVTTGIIKIMKNTSFHFFGAYHLLFWFMMLTMLVTMRRRKDLLKIGIIAIILLAPIITVVNLLGQEFSWARYLFQFSVFILFIGMLWGKEMLEQRGWRTLIVIPMLFIVVVLFIKRDNELKATILAEGSAARKTAEEFLHSNKAYISSRQDTWFYDGLREIYGYFYGKNIETKIIPERERIRYISEERRSEILSHGHHIDESSGTEFKKNVITGEIIVDGYRANWNLGPYQTGTYIIIRGRYAGLYNYVTEVNSRGTYLFGQYYPDNRPEVFYLRVVYQSPEGWEGISDEYRIEIPGKSTIHLDTH